MAQTSLDSDKGSPEKFIHKQEGTQDLEPVSPTDIAHGYAPVKKQFTAVTLLSMAFVICNSWAGVSGSLQLALLQGGPVTLVYSILFTTTAYLSVAASLAELASVYPTAGGQYHFASILSPSSCRLVVSYACGLLALFSWVAIGASVTIIIAEQILATVGALHDGFVTKTWQVFLVYQGLSIFALLYNALALKRAPWTHNIGFFLTISLFVTSFIGYLVRAHSKQPSTFVWTTFINYTGWPNGLCFLIGTSTACYMYIGIDASLHMAEECIEPERMVPRTIMSAVGIGFVTAFAYTVAVLYALTDVQEIMTTTQWIPFLVAQQGFRSTTFAVVITIIGIFMSLFIIIAIQETSSRLAWSFARDEGVLLSKYVKQVHPQLDVPIYALLFSWVFIFICGFIYLASETAFNALVGSSIVLQQQSFAIPLILLLIQRRSTKFLRPQRSFRLPGVLGWVINIYVVLFTILMTVVFSLPIFMPTNASSMNYTCVILGVAFLLGAVNWWLYARKHYNGPTIELYGIGSHA